MRIPRRRGQHPATGQPRTLVAQQPVGCARGEGPATPAQRRSPQGKGKRQGGAEAPIGREEDPTPPERQTRRNCLRGRRARWTATGTAATRHRAGGYATATATPGRTALGLSQKGYGGDRGVRRDGSRRTRCRRADFKRCRFLGGGRSGDLGEPTLIFARLSCRPGTGGRGHRGTSSSGADSSISGARGPASSSRAPAQDTQGKHGRCRGRT